MENFIQILLYGITFSPVMMYGIGFQKTLSSSHDMKNFYLQIPQIILQVILSILVLWPICFFFLEYNRLYILFPIFLIFVVTFVDRLLYLILPSSSPNTYLNDIFSISVVLISIHSSFTLLDALLLGFLSCCTLVIMTVLLDFAKKRMIYSNIPVHMKGTPLFLVFMGILSLIFLGTSVSWWISGR